MTLPRLLRLFARRGPAPPLSPDLAGADLDRVAADMAACAAGTAGALSLRRRAIALVALYPRLSTAGQARFRDAVERLGGDAVPVSERYARIEETELFGRSSSKLAILDAFLPPRRRLLLILAAQPGGRDLLATLHDAAAAAGRSGLAADIAAALAGET